MSLNVPSDVADGASATERPRRGGGERRVEDRHVALDAEAIDHVALGGDAIDGSGLGLAPFRCAGLDGAGLGRAGFGGEAVDHVALDGAQVWLVDLRASDERYARALALLSDAERTRARALRSEQAARRFVLARAALRIRLGHALAIAPELVTLRYGEHGKPEIAPPPRATVRAARVSQGPSRFNLAHCDGAALLAVSHRRNEIGIDIERIAPESERSWRKLLERTCHPCEANDAMAEARTIGARAFYERWVGKEAVLKALGVGLRVSPAEVGLRRDEGGVLRVWELPGRRVPTSGLPAAAAADGCATSGVDGDLAGCRLAAVRTPPGYVGAVALLLPAS